MVQKGIPDESPFNSFTQDRIEGLLRRDGEPLKTVFLRVAADEARRQKYSRRPPESEDNGKRHVLEGLSSFGSF